MKIDLDKEAEAIFCSSGAIVLVESNDESDSALTISRRATALKVTHVPERNALRWETDNEYGFERIKEPIDQLARTLMKRL